ncbi:MAG: RimK family alpha-L-glutamate ligase [archaeon GB-1867-005]|nr:RimK family alpha-L-glutamate ligase [Candidatus Culexmicrobium cathedralense]
MIIGVATRNPKSWCSIRLGEAIKRKGHQVKYINLSKVAARIGANPTLEYRGLNLAKDIAALIVRPIGRGSLDEVIFRLDLLHRLEMAGIPVINSPKSIELCVDKYHALMTLSKKGLPVPKTAVTEDVENAMKLFHELGGDVIVKPLFGSRGFGIVRVSDPDMAFRVFRALEIIRSVIYIQEFIPHGTKDIRAFVIGDNVIASMYREATGWKTNIAQGAKPKPAKLKEEVRELAIKAARATGCEIAGVDILESPNGYYIVEINSMPGWEGLQKVSKVNIAEEIVSHVLNRVKKSKKP